MTAETDVTAGDLIEIVPADWTLADAGDGQYSVDSRTITWPLGPIDAGSTEARTITVVAPVVPTSDGSYELPATFAAHFDQGESREDASPETVLVAPRIVVSSFTLALLSGIPPEARYLLPGTPVDGQQRFDIFRVRFDPANPDTVPVAWSPQLEYRGPSGAWIRVAAAAPADGVAFYVSKEWIANPGPEGGTMLGPDAATIAAEAGNEKNAANQAAIDGIRSMSANPLPPRELPSLTEMGVEFSVRATVDAAYLASYEFRMTDASQSIPGAIQPIVSMGPQPGLALSPGQRDGALIDAAPGSGAVTGPASRYGLLAPSAPALGGTAGDPIHGPYSLTSDSCGACHRAHTASGPSLTTTAPPQYGLCIGCHDGSRPPTAANLKAEYQAAPINDAASRSFYQHDPTQVAGHASAESDVFAGVSNRHAECTDCHNPHRAAASPDANPDVAGWTISGRLEGASGVTVANGNAGAAPAYTLVPAATREYELCFKCHSGYTQLLPNPTPVAPSPTPYTQFELDKGVELNPANLSYHPIEAPGRNATAEMDASLAGTSPYKLWNFSSGSTIRCANCHADSAKLPAVVPVPAPSAGTGSSLPVHASQNRGILIQPYLDRTLKAWTEAYSAADFALCYSCHAEAPFVDTSGNVRPDTNFRYHGVHVSGGALLGHGSPTTSIDTPGNGGGLATCSECHFRIHSTTFAVPGQAIDGQRLVNFAPDVVPAAVSATLGWTAKTPTEAGTCTLTCHGQPHVPRNY